MEEPKKNKKSLKIRQFMTYPGMRREKKTTINYIKSMFHIRRFLQ